MSGSLGKLWAPWRYAFLQHSVSGGCFFCRAVKSRQDKRHQVIARHPKVFAILNRYPYNNGHLMVAPRRHVGDLLLLTPAEWAGLLAVSQKLIRRLKKSLKPHGFNIGMNLGRVGGAGIPGHLHLHIVPRWRGDTNFMPILTNAKVISQSLEELYRLLSD